MNQKTLAILHTTPATIDPLKELAAEMLPGCGVIDFVDDSILPLLARNGGNVQPFEERLVCYGRFAEQSGADVILSACSSVGELVTSIRQAVSVPVIRIDEAMAEEAVHTGSRIGVAATLATTLNPTVRLLRQKADEAGRAIEVFPEQANDAYQLLMAGDKDAHDRVLARALGSLAKKVDLVVLAQASMARVLAAIPEDQHSRFLTSPKRAMEQVRSALALCQTND